MEWRTYYRNRTLSPEKVVKMIKPGNAVGLGEMAGEPRTIIKAMANHPGNLQDVKVFQGLSIGPGELVTTEGIKIYTYNVGPAFRKAVLTGKVCYLPLRYSQIERFLDMKKCLDFAFLQVSPPDNAGYCSFGLVVGAARAFMRNARCVIAEVNEQMPRTNGDTLVHVTEFDWFIETTYPPLTPKNAQGGGVARKIGAFVAELVPDGSTLQLGIGTLMDTLLDCLSDKHDLGIHSGILGDGIVPLIEKGVVNGRFKSVYPNKVVTASVLGTEKLYEFVHLHPLIEFRPYSVTHSSSVLSQIKNFIAINSAVEVDLTGQVNAESLGRSHISGIGGQADFVNGALNAPGGRSIIVLPSTARGGNTSRIVPFLAEGATVSSLRSDVHFIVTEYGVAELWGKDINQRAQLLINIAHPNFRNYLRQQFTHWTN
ncbi:acetyl-CoA hydrolase/transferase family protein [Desulfofundulus thermosubterraneus]|uniref:4-hydroxybutyrate CoA-transferase n=1 Tax=Desulfofundulus thermosubterraneus DSM 16057 TaxID=1121432 RepID=A0A1M6IM97_9FIRM|nr:acetyl-CoA hydrolase/transferase C-terminal domain-containing protein [Desulfofundulus thermosubterraneus]SHJ35538.1 4-hydroxybutyrate CoA-transferase [Desulfofundulus thermosubterraneus DSM 16057]